MTRAGERQRERILDRSEEIDINRMLSGLSPTVVVNNFTTLAEKYERETVLHGHTMVFRIDNGKFFIDVYREETNEEFAQRIRDGSKKRGVEKIETAQRKKQDRASETLKEMEQKFSFEQFVRKHSQ